VKVHIDVPSAMTGVSRFGELHEDWIYSKNETEAPEAFPDHYTHLLSGNPSLHEEHYSILSSFYGFKEIQFSRHPPFVIVNKNSEISLLAHKHWPDLDIKKET